jgi:hypothetical protein
VTAPDSDRAHRLLTTIRYGMAADSA